MSGIRLPGFASWATRAPATAALMRAGVAAPTATLFQAAILITGGAVLAAGASARVRISARTDD